MEHFEDQERGLKLLKSLSYFRDKKFFCDFEIRVGAHIFPVHRYVLASSSDYFKTLFLNDDMTCTLGFVDIAEVSALAIDKCLKYIYSGEVELELESVEEVLNASVILGIGETTAFCSTFLISSLSVQECLSIFKTGKKFRDQKVIAQSEDFIKKNYEAVILTKHYLHLEKDEVIHLLLLNNARSLSILWKAVRTWIYHNKSDRQYYLLELLRVITTIDASTSTVIDMIVAEDLLTSCPDAFKYLVTQVLFNDPFFMEREISIDNYLLLKQLIEMYMSYPKSSCALTTVMRFIQINFIKVSKSEDFSELRWEDIERVFISKNFNPSVTEKDKYEAILKWISGNEKERRRHFLWLFQCLNLKRISSNYIQNVIRKNPMVQGSEACKDLVTDAFYAQLSRKTSLLRKERESWKQIDGKHEVNAVFNEKAIQFHRISSESTASLPAIGSFPNLPFEKRITNRIQKNSTHVPFSSTSTKSEANETKFGQLNQLFGGSGGSPFGTSSKSGFGSSTTKKESTSVFGASQSRSNNSSFTSPGDGSVAFKGFRAFGKSSGSAFGAPAQFGSAPSFDSSPSFGSVSRTLGSGFGSSTGGFGINTASSDASSRGYTSFAKPGSTSFGNLANQSGSTGFGNPANRNQSLGFGGFGALLQNAGASSGFGSFGNQNNSVFGNVANPGPLGGMQSNQSSSGNLFGDPKAGRSSSVTGRK